MKKIVKIESISQLHKSLDYPSPKHPLISILDLSKTIFSTQSIGVKVNSSYYSIYLKVNCNATLMYGRGYYDYEEGTLVAISPEQVIAIENNVEQVETKGWSIHFHPDLIRQYPLYKKMSQYGFFSYETNEALHLSEEERETITSVIKQIDKEYNTNIDEFSQDVLVTSVELLLNYIQRFYKRQFITRKLINSDVLSTFESLIKTYFDSDELEINGLPKVTYFANKMNLSANYLSDLLIKETGKNTQTHIHYYLIEKAKYLLLNSNATVSQISYQLGFEYPQYFSRIFKKKTSYSPTEFKQLN